MFTVTGHYLDEIVKNKRNEVNKIALTLASFELKNIELFFEGFILYFQMLQHLNKYSENDDLWMRDKKA